MVDENKEVVEQTTSSMVAFDDTLLSEGTNPFANNGQGALQPFEDPFYEKYVAYKKNKKEILLRSN